VHGCPRGGECVVVAQEGRGGARCVLSYLHVHCISAWVVESGAVHVDGHDDEWLPESCCGDAEGGAVVISGGEVGGGLWGGLQGWDSQRARTEDQGGRRSGGQG